MNKFLAKDHHNYIFSGEYQEEEHYSHRLSLNSSRGSWFKPKNIVKLWGKDYIGQEINRNKFFFSFITKNKYFILFVCFFRASIFFLSLFKYIFLLRSKRCAQMHLKGTNHWFFFK